MLPQTADLSKSKSNRRRRCDPFDWTGEELSPSNAVPPEALDPLLTRRQWVAWQYQSIPGKEKPQKNLFNPTRSKSHPQRTSIMTPRGWGTYARAAEMDGIGIVLTRNLGLTLVDLDNCFDGAVIAKLTRLHRQVDQTLGGHRRTIGGGR